MNLICYSYTKILNYKYLTMYLSRETKWTHTLGSGAEEMRKRTLPRARKHEGRRALSCTAALKTLSSERRKRTLGKKQQTQENERDLSGFSYFFIMSGAAIWTMIWSVPSAIWKPRQSCQIEETRSCDVYPLPPRICMASLATSVAVAGT